MTDPFDALRITDSPLDPRPEFADELRRTIAANLETDMTHTDTPVTTQTAATQTVTAYISVRNAAAAIAFYVEAFEAVEVSRLVGDDGRIGHAEIMIGSSKLMLADEYPEIDVVGPQTREGRHARSRSRCPTSTRRSPMPSPRAQPSNGPSPTSSTATGWVGCATRSVTAGR